MFKMYYGDAFFIRDYFKYQPYELFYAYLNLLTCVAYTFDAGPNACLFFQESDVEDISSVIQYVFPSPTGEYVEYVKGIPLAMKPLSQEKAAALDLNQQKPGLLKYVIHTQPGDGPKVLEADSPHLLNDSGLPIKH